MPDAEIPEHFLGATKNRVELLRALSLLNELAHAAQGSALVHYLLAHELRVTSHANGAMNLPSLGQTSTTKDIDGVIGNVALETGRLHLEECNLPSKVS